MSVKIMSAVFEAQIPDQEYLGKGGKPTTVKSSTLKFILVALADHASDTGESVYPSIEYLQKKTSFGSCATCVAAIGALEMLGIISQVGTRIRGNKEYRISLSKILEFHPVKSTVSPSEKESSLIINEPSINPIPEQTTGKDEPFEEPIRPVVRIYDPDEPEVKPKKKANVKPRQYLTELEPKTQAERVLFGMIGAEITRTRGPGAHVPHRWPAAATRDLYFQTVKRLGEKALPSAVNAALQTGILQLPKVVKYIASIKPKPVYTQPKPYEEA